MSSSPALRVGLHGCVALVTGGASGIGRACSLALADSGSRVAVADRNVRAAAEVVESIRHLGAEAIPVEVDVSERAAVEAAVGHVLEGWGRLDILVHCAGIAMNKPVVATTDEEWRAVLTTNLDGTFYSCRAAARAMLQQHSGTIILMASDRGLIGARGRASYAASKGGFIAFMRSLAVELGAAGVTVNAINPGTTNTPMARGSFSDQEWAAAASRDPLGRLSEPEEIARTVLFLAASPNVTGQLLTTRMRVV